MTTKGVYEASPIKKQASTLPPEPRSEGAVDDPTPSNDDLGDIPAELDRRARA